MFLSSYENKLDKKGRVSVPATFRAHLSTLGYNGFITYPSFNNSALEGCTQDRIERINDTIDSLIVYPCNEIILCNDLVNNFRINFFFLGSIYNISHITSLS